MRCSTSDSFYLYKCFTIQCRRDILTIFSSLFLSQLSAIRSSLEQPFYMNIEFIVPTILGILSVIFSLVAATQARKAKTAAIEAGTAVSKQKAVIELSEISRMLDSLDSGIQYSTARNLVSEVTRRIRRYIAPYRTSGIYSHSVSQLDSSLLNVRRSLSSVRPIKKEEEDTTLLSTVYNAIEFDISALNNCLADFIGILEQS